MKRSLLSLLLLSLLISCGSEVEHKLIFLPDTIDEVTNFSLSDHTKEANFTGNWEAPVLTGKGRGKTRKLSKGAGKLKFISVGEEKYILDTVFSSPDKNISILLNGSKLELEGSKKFLSEKLIRKGENFISFLHEEGLKFNNISIFPKRILRIRNNSELIKNEKILFLPGSLRYFIKPAENEHISLKLDLNGKKKVKLNIHLKAKNETSEYSKLIRDSEIFKIELLKGKFQEVIISIPGLKKGFVKITESFLVRKVHFRKKDKNRIKEIRALVKGRNLLLILLDATRSDRTGYDGYTRRTTPNIDKFSINSQVFSNCYSEASYTLAEMFQSKNYFTGAISANPNFGKAYKFDKGFTEFNELFFNNPVVQAEQFLDPFKKMLDHSGGKPFFVYLHLREPHDPFAMPQPFLNKFQNKFSQVSENIPSVFKASRSEYEKNEEIRSLLGNLYDGNLAYGDMVFGKLIEILNRRELSSDTIVVFLSDHGEALGEHGVYGHGHVLYQQSMRIPLIIKIPGLNGKTYNSQVITSDLVRTLSDIFMLPYPYKVNSYGRNMLIQETERRLFVRSINAFNYPGYMIQQYPYKFIIHFPYNDSTMELFNLEANPGENQSIKDRPLIKRTLLFYLFNHLRTASEIKQEIANPELRKDDIKSLKSLGYL